MADGIEICIWRFYICEEGGACALGDSIAVSRFFVSFFSLFEKEARIAFTHSLMFSHEDVPLVWIYMYVIYTP